MLGSGGPAGRLPEVAARLASSPDARFGALSGAGILGFLVFVAILFPAPLPVMFLGLVLGSLSAMVAMGLVLVYRANRIVNFAQGDLGGVAAVLAASLIVGPKWPYLPAAIAGLAAAMLLGWGTEVAVIRRFATAPRLILTVATIGLQQLFAATQLALPSLFDYDRAPSPPVPFDFTFEWFPLTFNAGHLVIIVTVPLVAAGLAAFFRYTDIGIAVRASAESADRASLLGIPVKRINTLVWIIAAALSGLAVLLRMPIQGVNIGAILGPSLLLRALAAAVIARMDSLGRTFAAALVLGMIEQAVLFETGNTIIVDAILFFIILGALLLQRRSRMGRAEDTGASTWTATREVRPIPRELWRVPLVRNTVGALAAVAGVFLLVVPLRMGPGTVSLFGTGLIFAIVIISLLVLTGWAGQISLAQLSFVAFGSAVAGVLAQQGKHFFVALLVSGLVGALAAMVIGVPALRIRGLFLAVATLAFALTTGSFFINPQYFPALYPDPTVRVARPILFNKFDLNSEFAYYYVVLLLFFLIVGSVRSLRNSRTGRSLIAVRDNSRAAQSYGVSPIRAQLVAFAIAGFYAGLAGGILFFHQQRLSPSVLETEPNIRIFSMAVIGGLGSIPGAIFGSAFQMILDFSPFTRAPESRLLGSGLGLLFILLVIPSGLSGALYAGRDILLRTVARRKDILVPSLMADVRVLEEEQSGGEEATEPIRRGRLRARPSDEAVIKVEDLDVAYGKTQVLFGVDFHVEPDEIVALLGTNGAGKSTLLRTISGLNAPTGGTITYDGKDISKWGPNQTVADGIVLMPGSKGIFPTLTVEENLRLAAWLYRKDPAYVREVTDQVLEYFPILRERWNERAGNMSGGEQQMLTLGQVFVAKPKVLMIDELSLGLAPVVVERLLEIVRRIHERGTSVVLVEQSVNVAITLAERAVFLEKGEVRFEGPTEALLERPDILRAVFLRGAASVDGDGHAEVTEVAKAPFVPVCEHCGREHPEILRTDSLAVSFGGVQAVDDVSLTVRHGEILGIIGPNGAGKTTVFDLVSGFVQPTRGRIELDGVDITPLSADARAILGLGRSFQDALLFPSMTVRQTIATALERHVSVRDPLAAMLMSPAVVFAERKIAEEVGRLIELMNLEAFADKFIGELSTGTRRIVDLACAIAHDPKVLLLDEPSSGLAQRETEAMGPVLLDLREKTGASLVIIEHDMPLIQAVSDELIALELGSIVARGTPEAVIDDPRVVEGYLGSSEDVILRSGRRTSSRKRRTAAKRKRAGGRS